MSGSATHQNISPWVPQLSIEELDDRLENAMRRVSGSVGFDISRDLGKTKTITNSASRAMDAGLHANGPMFMRVGQGALEAGMFSIGKSLNLEEIGGEILSEFFTEGTAAFQVARTTLYTDALSYLQKQGLEDRHCTKILDAAEATLMMPQKDIFTREALPLIKQGLSPMIQGLLAGVVGYAVCIFLMRSPIVGIVGGLAAAIMLYTMARNRLRHQATMMLCQLPRKLYGLLATEWNSNAARYADTVNASVRNR